MNQDLPQRSARYCSNAYDSERWDHFSERANDVFVCAPPRTGTTWTQTLCCLLIHGWRDFAIKPSDVSPWYDATFFPVEEVNAIYENQQHRRVIKTHTPLDGISYFPRATYLAVYRDPRDVFFSFRNHLDNFRDNDFVASQDDDISALFQEWVRSPAQNDMRLSQALEQFTVHYASFHRFSDLPNIHFLHYADMREDLASGVAELADILGIEVGAQDIAEICRIADFDNMKKNSTQYTPDAKTGMWHNNERFFHKGKSGQWRDVLSPGDLASYEDRLHALLPAEDIDWLHNVKAGLHIA